MTDSLPSPQVLQSMLDHPERYGIDGPIEIQEQIVMSESLPDAPVSTPMMSDGEMLQLVFDQLPGTMYLSEFHKLAPALHAAYVRGFEAGVTLPCSPSSAPD